MYSGYSGRNDPLSHSEDSPQPKTSSKNPMGGSYNMTNMTSMKDHTEKRSKTGERTYPLFFLFLFFSIGFLCSVLERDVY
ncbi:hypothetical protein RJ53_10450 [Methanocalculus chunghsingensis]|uniref:Uncharacterized protein n=1 Tax=Methanocalculus chunghsingensis TaxID=156457 RepID=A0A8J7W7F7_9EURY|nr:hypothetical protein [Methanocalculus chunghsingensis]